MAIKLKLSIPEPCNKSWATMDVSQSGKYCHHCEKEVIDFTKLSPEELKNWFISSSGKVCGRINPDQLIAVNKQSPPAIKFGTASTKILLAACFTIVTNLKTSAASVAKQTHSIDIHNNIIEKKHAKNENLVEADSLVTITGIVSSKADGLPILGVNVKPKLHSSVAVLTDKDGRFTIKVKPNEVEKVILTFTYIGYLSLEQEITLFNKDVKVVMEEDPNTILMGEVVIVSHGSSNLFLNLFYKLKNWIR